MKIVVPILYTGGIKPKEPKEGDIWNNDYSCEICVYFGDKWFQCKAVKNTGYTEMQKEEMQKREKIDESELDKYKNVLRTFKQLLNEID